jgi:neutral ceramidase
MPSLKAGWAKSEITPPPGYPMAGYVRRTGVATGVLHPLYARVLVLEYGGCTLALVIADVLLFSDRWTRRLRSTLARSLGVAASHIILGATHTHSGPLMDTTPFDVASTASARPRPGYARFLERRIRKAVREAAARMQPVEAAIARVSIRGVASDRNRPRSSRAQPLDLLRLSGRSGRAVLGVYGCHSTVLGYKNTRFSGDLLGRLTQRLEPQHGFALIACGAAANISTRFTRRNQSVRELERLSLLAARQTKRAVYKPLRVEFLAVRETHLALGFRKFPPVRPEATRATGRLAEAAEEARENLRRLRRARKLGQARAAYTLTQIRLGGVSWLAMPFEIGSETGEFLERRARVIPLCYANGYSGYIPPSGASPHDYEVISSPFARQADLQLRRVALRLASRP